MAQIHGPLDPDSPLAVPAGMTSELSANHNVLNPNEDMKSHSF
jgi:hypothetical protein